MSNASFWKPVYQLFKPEEPLVKPEDLRDFYVRRADSPIESLVSTLAMEDDPAKFLLAGHRGSGKTTELGQLAGKLSQDYAVIWLDTATALNRYNIGYAEVVVLVGLEILRKAYLEDWILEEKLRKDLEDSLKTVIDREKSSGQVGLGLPFLEKLGLILKSGLSQEITKTLNIRPVLSDIVDRVNAIVRAAEEKRAQKLVVIVDGLDRHDRETALPMFSSSLLVELDCHIIYTIPISVRYTPNFRQPMQSFQKCLDLTNIPVFECDDRARPTNSPNQFGRALLSEVIRKRLQRLGNEYAKLFQDDALELLCEKSGGVMRDLIRLARTACEVALQRKLTEVDFAVADEAVKQERKAYTLSDYHFPELAGIHRTGDLTTKTYSLPSKGEFVICDELLQNKFVLGYYDDRLRDFWFDVNPIILEDLERWQAANPDPT